MFSSVDVKYGFYVWPDANNTYVRVRRDFFTERKMGKNHEGVC